ncbi:DUF1456 family protein [Sediminicola arcticus]|jgi:hypothetical protein|uniref:DUF1456 family protein n=1 Tax=Sediminicola arcticus TaxID=1574308 RepID=A0ABV2SSL9_9FLAO
MTNNDIFKKLRVALMLRDDEIVEILKLVDFKISKSEIGALFRKEDHPKYVECGDQILRNFLNGLVIHLRGTKENPKIPKEVIYNAKTVESQPTKPIPEPPSKPAYKGPKKENIPDISYVKYKNKKKS